MKAMILAAGFGTRLKPITDHTPKALVKIQGITLLEILIRKMIQAGIKEIIINAHYLADQLVEFIHSKNSFGIHIEFSIEDELLDTGGGLKHAQWFFKDNKPFLLHNVDILSDLDFLQFYNFHIKQDNLVSLACNERKANRVFLFNSENELCGWRNHQTGNEIFSKSGSTVFELGFSGIHMINPALFNYFPKGDIFSLTPFYLEVARKKSILAFIHDSKNWFDVGKIETLNFLEENYSFSF